VLPSAKGCNSGVYFEGVFPGCRTPPSRSPRVYPQPAEFHDPVLAVAYAVSQESRASEIRVPHPPHRDNEYQQDHPADQRILHQLVRCHSIGADRNGLRAQRSGLPRVLSEDLQDVYKDSWLVRERRTAPVRQPPIHFDRMRPALTAARPRAQRRIDSSPTAF